MSPVLILGASGGLGSACARKLAAEGRAVILHGRDRAKLEALATTLNGAETCVVDLRDASAVQAMAAMLAKEYQRLSGVVFSVAAPFANKLTHRQGWDGFQAQIDSQLKALHLAASALFPLLADGAETARLIVLSTEYVLGRPPLKTAPYVAAKAALTAYAKVIAQEWLSRNVRVHILAPGLVKTDLVAAMPEEFLKNMAAAMPERRLTSPEDVADMAAFLMTPAADSLYGQPLQVSRAARR